MNTQKGQSLVEVLAVLGIAIGIISAITIAVISSLTNVERGKTNALATSYAQTGMEIVRTQRQTDVSLFRTFLGSYCLAKACSSIIPSDIACGTKSGSACPQNVDSYIREVTFQPSDGSCEAPTLPPPTPQPPLANNTKVTVSVYWNDGKCQGGEFCQKVQLVSCFSDTNIVNSP